MGAILAGTRSSPRPTNLAQNGLQGPPDSCPARSVPILHAFRTDGFIHERPPTADIDIAATSPSSFPSLLVSGLITARWSSVIDWPSFARLAAGALLLTLIAEWLRARASK